MRALIVDDSRSMRSILRRTVSSFGFTGVDEADNGAAALARLDEDVQHSTTPDVVLVDWNMPVMGGREFIVELRKQRAFDRIKVLVVTSESSPRVVLDALAAGADDFAMKPVTREIIADKLAVMGML
jgi:two-component system chemotaxis response regulator CheY